MKIPDLSGPHGMAWKVSPNPQALAQIATLSAWLVNGSFHPLWNFWEVAVIHLRPIPGVPNANKKYPEAEYEFMIVSLDPDHEPNPDDPETLYHLRPIDLVYQCHGLSDQQAVEINTSMIKNIVDNGASPDSDYARFWFSYLDLQVYMAGKSNG